MPIAHQLTDLIGNTPLLALERFAPGARILAKLECFNPLSSAKDRAALSMLDAAEAAGQLRPGTVIIEPTSGNTGWPWPISPTSGATSSSSCLLYTSPSPRD